MMHLQHTMDLKVLIKVLQVVVMYMFADPTEKIKSLSILLSESILSHYSVLRSFHNTKLHQMSFLYHP
jgi:hypothetical protein